MRDFINQFLKFLLLVSLAVLMIDSLYLLFFSTLDRPCLVASVLLCVVSIVSILRTKNNFF